MQQVSSSASAEAHTHQQNKRKAQSDRVNGFVSSAHEQHPSCSSQNFHTHGLLSVFKFLEFCDLPSVTSTCIHWRDVLYNGHSCQLELERFALGQLPSLIASPLRHHVHTLDMYEDRIDNLVELQVLQQLPFLTKLCIRLPGDLPQTALDKVGGDKNATSIFISRLFPSRVKDLHVVVKCTHDESPLYQILVDALGMHSQLTTLRLSGNVEINTGFILDSSALFRLPMLTDLSFSQWNWTLPMITILRTCTTLEKLDVGEPCNDEFMSLFCDPLHNKLKRLQSFKIWWQPATSAASMYALGQLPALAELDWISNLPDALSYLPLCFNLKKFKLMYHDGTMSKSNCASDFIRPLKACPQLLEITMNSFSFTETDMVLFANTLQQIQTCTFNRCTLCPMDSLKGMLQLRELVIYNLWGALSEHIVPSISHIPSLRDFTIQCTYKDEMRSLLSTPPFQHIQYVYVV